MIKFHRKIDDFLADWKMRSGHKPLIVKGARQIGKTKAIEYFAEHNYTSIVEINFALQKEYRAIFDNGFDVDKIIRNISLIEPSAQFVPGETLIFFDELQDYPNAATSLKAFSEDGRYDVICSGSMLGINYQEIESNSVGHKEDYEMHSMDFEEFLWAKGDTTTSRLLANVLEKFIPLGDAVHRKLMRDFRLYMLVGGMPQAVETYMETNNFRKVDEIKRDILKLYEDDFRTIDTSGRISMLFDAIPAQLNTNASRYQVSSVLNGERADTVLELIADMVDSKTVQIAYHANDPNVGLANAKDIRRFKLFLADTGLLTTLIFKDKDFTENIVYEKILSDKLSVNLGYVYENIVAQILSVNGHALYYHTFLNEKSKHNYEIDFLLSKKNKICPMEVKSSGYNTHKSLDAFSNKYSERILEKYLVYTKDLKKEGDILMIPIYLLPFFRM